MFLFLFVLFLLGSDLHSADGHAAADARWGNQSLHFFFENLQMGGRAKSLSNVSNEAFVLSKYGLASGKIGLGKAHELVHFARAFPGLENPKGNIRISIAFLGVL